MELRKLGMVGLGFVAGIAFVVACPSPMDVSTSVAEFTPPVRQPSGCRQWTTAVAPNDENALKPGWEPFAAYGDGYKLWVRKCIELEW